VYPICYITLLVSANEALLISPSNLLPLRHLNTNGPEVRYRGQGRGNKQRVNINKRAGNELVSTVTTYHK
jgi:hypothetical protein